MTQEKIINIFETMIEYNLIDPVRAKYDKEYFVESIRRYIEAANITRSILHMSPLV